MWSTSLAALTLQFPCLAVAFPTATPAPLDLPQRRTPRRRSLRRRSLLPDPCGGESPCGSPPATAAAAVTAGRPAAAAACGDAPPLRRPLLRRSPSSNPLRRRVSRQGRGLDNASTPLAGTKVQLAKGTVTVPPNPIQ